MVYTDGVSRIPVNTKWLSSQAEGILTEIIQKVRLSKYTCIMLLPSATKFMDRRSVKVQSDK